MAAIYSTQRISDNPVFWFQDNAAVTHESGGVLLASSASMQSVASRADPVLTITQADINAIVNAILAAGIIPTADETAAAVLAVLRATAIPVNVTQFNSNPITGTGRPDDPVTAL